MSVTELRAESARRGLGTARARADLIQRLTGHDGEQQPSLAEGEYVLSGEAVRKTAVSAETISQAGAASASPRAFRQDFEAEPGGPDEETHLAHRQATAQAAVEAGHLPRGDARLAATVDGRWVYEVSVRQVT
ncbi:SAP domain-containing protein [Streptomyces sp. NPDC060027]|uniref:SAP domain-containing protein n=1 Tax=Streptomyces sp. NPDC060027 TaxID=3347040 RepID=UPI00369B250D